MNTMRKKKIKILNKKKFCKLTYRKFCGNILFRMVPKTYLFDSFEIFEIRG